MAVPAAGAGSSRAVFLTLVLAGAVALLAILGLAAMNLLGKESDTQVAQTEMSSAPTTSDDAPSDITTTTEVPTAPALEAPKATILGVCADLGPDTTSVSVPEGFAKLDGGATEQFAHVVVARTGAPYPDLDASVNMSTGEIEQSPFESRLVEMGSSSAVAVCVRQAAEPSTTTSMLCAEATDSGVEPSKYVELRPDTYEVAVVELATGERLGSVKLAATVAGCPDEYTKVVTGDVEAELAKLHAESRSIEVERVRADDEQFEAWTVKHLAGGELH